MIDRKHLAKYQIIRANKLITMIVKFLVFIKKKNANLLHLVKDKYKKLIILIIYRLIKQIVFGYFKVEGK